MPSGVYEHKPHSDRCKKKMSKTHKGKTVSEKTRRKISIARKKRKEKYGYLNSLKTRKKISKSKKGKLRGRLSKKWKGGYQRKLWLNNRRRVMLMGNGGSHTLFVKVVIVKNTLRLLNIYVKNIRNN